VTFVFGTRDASFDMKSSGSDMLGTIFHKTTETFD
jgi:hypothetical protein